MSLILNRLCVNVLFVSRFPSEWKECWLSATYDFRIFTWFHLISFILYIIYLYKHPFLGVEDLTYLTFVNTQNLLFRAKTWFFIIFERSAFIWINLPLSAGIGCHQNSRPAQVHRRWSSWWVPFSRCLFLWSRSPFGCGCGCPLLL